MRRCGGKGVPQPWCELEGPSTVGACGDSTHLASQNGTCGRAPAHSNHGLSWLQAPDSPPHARRPFSGLSLWAQWTETCLTVKRYTFEKISTNRRRGLSVQTFGVAGEIDGGEDERAEGTIRLGEMVDGPISELSRRLRPYIREQRQPHE